jgi:hypothetical protein
LSDKSSSIEIETGERARYKWLTTQGGASAAGADRRERSTQSIRTVLRTLRALKNRCRVLKMARRQAPLDLDLKIDHDHS